MGEEGEGYQESGAECAHTGLTPPCFVARELFPDDFLKKPTNSSLLERINRLDQFLSMMEDKAVPEPKGNSSRHIVSPTPSSLENRCKPAESVLEEVEEKGTLVERVSKLEERVMKLQQMMSTKLRDDITSRGSATEATTSVPNDEAFLSHQCDAHVYDHDHEQCPQDPIDVEKHEVTTESIAPPSYYNQQQKGLVESENVDMSPRKQESPLHKVDLGHQGMGSSEGTSVEEEDARAPQPQNKKSQKLKRWIRKRLHMGSTTRQGQRTYPMTRCWSSHVTSPKSCWKGETHAHYRHRSMDEDSP